MNLSYTHALAFVVVVAVVVHNFQTVFFSETAGPTEAKLHVELFRKGGGQRLYEDPSHMTKMAARTNNSTNLKKNRFLLNRFQQNLVCSIGNSYPL